MTITALPTKPPYSRFLCASFMYTAIALLRMRRAVFAATICLLPVLIPLVVAWGRGDAVTLTGIEVFVKMVEMLYLGGLAPLMALFFATLLIGEEVESQTMPYLLTRPLPRGAFVLGKYLAYWVVVSVLLLPSLALTWTACTALGGMDISWGTFTLLLHYALVLIMALMGYGALCLLLGAVFRKPVIWGVAILFGWERVANFVPGYIDFLTMDKYVRALLPILPTERAKPVVQMALGTYTKQELLVQPIKATIVLLALSVLFVALTTLTVRWREYTNARAVGG